MLEVSDNLNRLKEMGKSLFLITHDPELIYKCCTYLLFIQGSKVLWHRPMDGEAVKLLRAFFSHEQETGAVNAPDKKLHASGEDYLEAVLVLQKEKGMVRSVGVARYMEVSKPSVCHAVATLKDGGFLTMDEDFSLRLTDIGREVAEQTMRSTVFSPAGLSRLVSIPRPRNGRPAGWSTPSASGPLNC